MLRKMELPNRCSRLGACEIQASIATRKRSSDPQSAFLQVDIFPAEGQSLTSSQSCLREQLHGHVVPVISGCIDQRDGLLSCQELGLDLFSGRGLYVGHGVLADLPVDDGVV